MLSRVEDMHVFESSEDVVGAASSSKYLRHKQVDHLHQDGGPQSASSQRLLRPSAHYRVNRGVNTRSAVLRTGSRQRGVSGASQSNDDREEEGEDEHLHPQHPYRMRKRVLSTENVMTVEHTSSRKSLQRVSGRALAGLASGMADTQPVELVLLPSGELRSRQDCPPGLALPTVSSRSSHLHLPANTKPRLRYDGFLEDEEERESSNDEAEDDGEVDEDDSEEEEEDECAVSEQRVDWKVAGRSLRRAAGRPDKRSVKRQSTPQQCNERFVSSPLSSEHPEVDDKFPSDDEDSSISPASESFASLSSDGSDEDEKAPVAVKARTSKRATASSHRNHARDLLKTNEATQQDKSERLLKLTRLEKDGLDAEEGTGSHEAKRTASARHVSVSGTETPKTKSGDVSGQKAKKSRPPALAQESPVYQPGYPGDGRASRTKRSPKMTIRHLMADDTRAKPEVDGPIDAGKKTKREQRLELKLEKEKKRVLDKMAQLLEEQGKNTQLHSRIEALEAQLSSRDDELAEKSKEIYREQDGRAQELQKQVAERVKALEEQLQVKNAAVARLEKDKKQLKAAVRKMKETSGEQDKDPRSRDKEEALKQQLEEMVTRVRQFLAKVERWKTSSKAAVECCDRQSDLSALMDKMWLDFPQLPGLAAKETPEDNDRSNQKQDEQSNMVLFLKKRLRLREDELLQMHAKYVELKELCARQCVREADLQNFINEHRLRGNLVIRKKGGMDTKKDEENQTQDRAQGQSRRREVKTKTIANRGTNTRSSYHADEQNELDHSDEYSDNQEDNDYSEEEETYPLRTPKVFVRVGRDGEYEHSPHTTSAVAEKLASERGRGRRRKESPQQDVERIRLVPSPSLTQRYERTPTPIGAATRKKRSAPVSSQSRSALPECPPGCGSRLSSTRKKAVQAALRTKASKRPTTATTIAGRGACGVSRPWM